MAPLAKSFALAGALCAALSSAAPVQKRENIVVWETSTTVEWTTVDITTTVYPPAEPTVHTSVVSLTPAEPTPEPEPTDEPTQAPPPPPQTTTTTTQAPPPPPQTTQAPPPPKTTTTQAPPPPPQTTTTQAPPPPPQTTQAPPPPPQTTQAPPPPSSGSGYTGACSKDSPCKGQVTYYDTATDPSAPSSCGWTNDGETEAVLALPHGLMKDSDCGRMVTVKYGGVTKQGKVVDKCMGCDSSSIDLSKHFFGQLAEMLKGRLYDVEWYME